jgi:large subunit ribosomal protein L32e
MIMKNLKLRTQIKRKKPTFLRSRAGVLVRVGMKWRAARGEHSKRRMHKREAGRYPMPGYGSPRDVRGLHPSGFEDVLVHNAAELSGMDAKSQACRIASTVGMRKRIEIVKKAAELKIKVLNPIIE